MRRRQSAILVLLCVAWLLAGCPQSAQPPPPPGAAGLFAGTSGPPQEVLLIDVQMLEIEVPVGSASGSEDIWSNVEEEPLRAGGSALGQNGFRVGLVRRNNWASLERIIKQLAGRQARDAKLRVLPNNVVPIELKRSQDAQALFVFRADRTLTGQDYPPCNLLLTLVFALNEDEPNQVIVVGQPQLCSVNQTQQLVEEQGRWLYVMRPTFYPIPDLTFRLSVPSGDIIVIGPGAGAQRPTSVAHHFLIKERDGMSFETVLVLVPSVGRWQARTVPLAPAGTSPPAPLPPTP